MLQRTRCISVSAILVSIFSVFLADLRHATAAEDAATSGANVSLASQAQSSRTFAWERFYGGTDDAQKEFGVARSDHAAIALQIGQRYRKTLDDPINWSPAVKAILLFELDENLMHTLRYGSDSGPAHELPILNAFHAAAISFSDRISRDRLVVRRELEESRSKSFKFQVAIIALGAFATILTGVRAALQGDTSIIRSIGVGAVVASALQLAASSINNFEGSQATALRDQRTLSQLQQLHWRVASDVLTRDGLCENPGSRSVEAMSVVDAWRTRLETVLDSSVESISKPGDLGGGFVSKSSDPPGSQVVRR